MDYYGGFRLVRLWWPKILKKPRLRLEKPRLKIPRKTPSPDALFILAMSFILFILGGGMFVVVNYESLPEGFMVIGELTRQTVIEGLVAFTFMIIGFIGFIVIYQSTKHVYRPSYAKTLLLIGIILALVGYVGLNWLFFKKAPGLLGRRR